MWLFVCIGDMKGNGLMWIVRGVFHHFVKLSKVGRDDSKRIGPGCSTHR